MAVDRFHPYVHPVDRSVVERVVGAHLAAPVTDVRHIPSGVNEVFLVSCAQQQVVVRFNVPAELGRFHKEAWCITRAREVGVEGPQVLAVGIADGYAFMTQSYVPGRRGDALSDHLRQKMWRDVGNYLRHIHSIPVGGFGEELSDLTVDDGGAAWRRYVTYNISSLTPSDPLLGKGVLDRTSHALLGLAFARVAEADLRFGLSHGDPSPWNVILGDDGVLHVLDWSEAHAHVVPHYDLGVILNGRLEEGSPEFGELLEGYGWDAADYTKIRREVLDLRSLIATDKVRWALDRKPELFADKARALQTLLRRV